MEEPISCSEPFTSGSNLIRNYTPCPWQKGLMDLARTGFWMKKSIVCRKQQTVRVKWQWQEPGLLETSVVLQSSGSSQEQSRAGQSLPHTIAQRVPVLPCSPQHSSALAVVTIWYPNCSCSDWLHCTWCAKCPAPSWSPCPPASPGTSSARAGWFLAAWRELPCTPLPSGQAGLCLVCHPQSGPGPFHWGILRKKKIKKMDGDGDLTGNSNSINSEFFFHTSLKEVFSLNTPPHAVRICIYLKWLR